MSEVKLNLIESGTILAGTIHGSIGDHCVAALSAEPETITELEAALERFQKDPPNFLSCSFGKIPEVDIEPYDAGILVIDLSARIVACESTYSMPGPNGTVRYHDGSQTTDVPISYCVPDDWIFLDSIEEYGDLCDERRERRLQNPPTDVRSILYGRPLHEFLATNLRYAAFCAETTPESAAESRPGGIPPLTQVAAIHAQWLLTPREDLDHQSPRDVMLAKQQFIKMDLGSRSLQWSMLLEGPPCLSRDSFAYRFAGFGFHEWVLYYKLIRHLLNTARSQCDVAQDFETLVTELELLQEAWLNEPNFDLEGAIPAIIIDNERKRLPEAMGGRSMVIDEDCPACKMLGDECEAGLEVCFWYLDGSNMDEHFAFSTSASEKEYLAELAEAEVLRREFEQEWNERKERIAGGEAVSDSVFDPLLLEEFSPFASSEPEPPEA